MLGQPLSMLLPPVVGLRLSGELPGGHHRHRPGAHHHRAAAPPRRGRQVRRGLRARGRRGAGREPGHHRQHVARVRRHVHHLPHRRGHHRLPALHRPRRGPPGPGGGLRQGAGAVARAGRRRARLLRDWSSSTSSTVVPSLAGPARPQDRVVAGRRRRAPSGRPSGDAPVGPVRDGAASRRRPPAGRRGRGDRRHHQLHQHLQPPGDGGGRPVGQAGRRRGAWPPSRGSRPRSPRDRGWSWTTWSGPAWSAPSTQLGFYLVGFGCTTCIGNSGPLLERPLRGGAGPRPVGRLGALGQPELRGPHPPRRPHELPGLAAAGGRLRPGRHHGHRPHHRPARARPATAGRSSWPTCGRARTRWPRPSGRRSARTMFRTRYASVFEGDERWQAVPVAAGRDLRLGPSVDLRAAAAVLRGHGAHSRRRCATSRAPGCSPCWATA